MARIQGDLPSRSFAFAKLILSLIDDLPNNAKGWEIGRQIIRSGTGIGANVREADHALTDREFAQKCSIARREASETCYWLELCQQCGLLKGPRLETALRESDELMRILATVVKSTQEYLAR